ncbi:MAG: M15 family metallopeptidase [Blautia sp.]|nr:M15 family metallopeptidase [Blautia sp.]
MKRGFVNKTILMGAFCILVLGCGRFGMAEDYEPERDYESGADEDIFKEPAYPDYLVLVNKEHPLPDGWEEGIDIIEMTNSRGNVVEIESTAYEAFLELQYELTLEGVSIDLDNAYRSVSEQEWLVDTFTEKYGEGYVEQYVAVPGYSEHHTGLALDLYLIVDGEEMYYNEELTEKPEVWEIVHNNLADYGFILRYPEGKEEITGYSYEPWHIRYVGVDAAQQMMWQGLTLEEYMGEA